MKKSITLSALGCRTHWRWHALATHLYTACFLPPCGDIEQGFAQNYQWAKSTGSQKMLMNYFHIFDT